MTHKGLSLIELLITVLLFSLIVLAVYDLYDQGSWLALKSERRVNLQDNARVALEQMERDLRMIGSGVPTQQEFGSATFWTPFIFVGHVNKLFFRGDVDNRNTILAAPWTSGAMTVHNADGICTQAPLVAVERGRSWGKLNCTSGSGTTLTVTAVGAVGPFANPGEIEITSPEHVFYRLSGDADNNGQCDGTEEPFCSIQRAELYNNQPQTAEPADGDFTTLATHISGLRFQYFVNSTGEMTAPLAGIQLSAVQMIRVTVQARGRTSEGGRWQDVYLTSDILVRDARY